MCKIIACIVFLLFFASVQAEPSIVIVGGGPAGLATAIEGRLSGASVTVIEKRKEYERRQTIFLNEESLQLLERWQIPLTIMAVTPLSEKERLGIIQIHLLEQALLKRAEELGVYKLCATLAGLGEKHVLAQLQSQEEISLPYDLLVCADGAKSNTRSLLGIEVKEMGKAIGGATLMQLPGNGFDVSEPIKISNYFLRRIKGPTVSLIFAQTSASNAATIDPALLSQLAKEAGWHEEAETLTRNPIGIFNIPVVLQQAKHFSNPEKSALLVGDAAATASFFQGRGANTALKTASLAGTFFKTHEFAQFDAAMQEATDGLIEDSRYLFIK